MQSLKEILEKVSRGEIKPEEAERILKLHAIEELSCLAKLDGNRELRKGIPEISLAEGKAPLDVVDICRKMLTDCGRVIVSRCGIEHLAEIKNALSDDSILEWHEKARIAVLKKKDYAVKVNGGKIAIITAGTSDIPVAEEAKVIAEEMGCKVYCSYDVGVAGIHRLFDCLKEVISEDVDVIVVVAGREGALASVVCGLVDAPVIAVPTSNSYGFGKNGLASLMAMLQSCSLGLAVVNIDGGVAAGAVATVIANRVAKFREQKK